VAKTKSDNRVVVYVDAIEAGAASRATVVRSDGKDGDTFLNAEVELFDLTLELDAKFQREAREGLNSFGVVLEYPDGRRLVGSGVMVKRFSTSQTRLVASRLAWGP
jgi:hypothetical protein